MIKLSKDKTKLKRRIPFKYQAVDLKEFDKCMIYIENFPENITHDQLAQIFKRAGHIKHVSMPKYSGSDKSKGFAFIQYNTPEEAKEAADKLNNFIPEELWNSALDNYIPVQGQVTQLKVMLKTEWLKLKDEMKQIKAELAILNPETMFSPQQSALRKVEGEEKPHVKKYGFESQAGSVVRIKGLS